MNSQLPFPRGDTFYGGGGNGLTLTATMAAHLEGTIYEVPDTVHGLGGKVQLRIVRNDTGGAITAANKFCEMAAAAAGDYGRRVDTFPANTAGAVCKPLDDAYAAGLSIPANDLFYVVEAGPCSVLVAGAVTTSAAGTAVATTTAGLVSGAVAAAGEFAVGVNDALPVADTNVLVHVNAGLQAPEA